MLNPMSQTLNRALICTSTMQVVNGRAAMNFERLRGVDYIDHLFVFHPNLNGAEEKIILIARDIGFDQIHDYTGKIDALENLFSLKNIFKLSNITLPNNTEIERVLNAIESDMPGIEMKSVFCRRLKNWEKFVIFNVFKKRAFNFIEDGIGDYTDFNKKLSVIRKVKIHFVQYVKWMISKIKGVDSKYIKHFIFNDISIINEYRLHKYQKSKTIGYEVKTILKNLSVPMTKLKKKILIVGALFSLNPYFSVSIEEEIDIYVKIVDRIKNMNDIKMEDLGFIPHPRFGERGKEILSDKLKCQLVENKYGIAELDFIRSECKKVYSFGSTASVNAKELLGIDTCFLKIDLLSRDKKKILNLEKASQHFGIPIKDISRI